VETPYDDDKCLKSYICCSRHRQRCRAAYPGSKSYLHPSSQNVSSIRMWGTIVFVPCT